MFGFLIGILAAFVLFFAGAWKLAAPEEIRTTLRALGTSAPEKVAPAIAVAELAVGGALVLAPESLLTITLVLTLGLAFATAGLVAIVRKISVRCACLGPALAGRLGIRQLLWLPVWIAVAAAGVVDPSPLSLDERSQLLVAVLEVLAAAAVVRLLPLWREHRFLRRALEGR